MTDVAQCEVRIFEIYCGAITFAEKFYCKFATVEYFDKFEQAQNEPKLNSYLVSFYTCPRYLASILKFLNRS